MHPYEAVGCIFQLFIYPYAVALPNTMARLASEGIPDDPCTQFRIGIDYFYGNNVRESKEEAFRWISMAAEKDLSKAHCFLGMMYGYGYGTEQSMEMAVKHVTRAAELCLPKAQYELGMMHHTGIGVEKSNERAAERWTQAADSGYGKAQFALAMLYEAGDGVPLDRNRAFRLFRDAANSGVVPAKCRIGIRYEEGIDTEVSYPDALRWFREAADEGDARALFEIGWMTYFGHGCAQSEKESKRIVEIAVAKGVMDSMTREAMQGNPYSQLRIGWLYDLGWGVEQCTYKAIAWYTGARVLGLDVANRFIENLGRRIGVTQGSE